MKKALVLGSFAAALLAQQSEIVIKLTSGEKVALAAPDFRGAGDAQQQMATFNQTLWGDLQDSGLFNLVPKTFYPLQTPQRPQDFLPPAPPTPPPRRGAPPPAVPKGPRLADWSGPPANSAWLAFGYAGVQDGGLVLFGWLYNVTVADLANAQVFGKIYFGTLDAAGARKVAHEFASDIIGRFGGASLAGSKIYFVSDRTGRGIKEIWSMDYDGANQKQLTFYKSLSTMPNVSPDGTKVAFTTFVKGNPMIMIHSLETGNRLPFYNQAASLNATADFTPDSKQIVYASTAGGGHAQIYIANVDGTNLHRISSVRAVEMEPKVNPKTGKEIVFISDRSGHPQIYKMNLDGADVTLLTPGDGDAANPAWHPDGQRIAFAWTKGFAPGNYNIFVMDVTTRELVQLTHGAGRNENPNWAPDGRHLVFSSSRSGGTQIFTILADGTQVKQLTTQGRNEKPVWGKR